MNKSVNESFLRNVPKETIDNVRKIVNLRDHQLFNRIGLLYKLYTDWKDIEGQHGELLKKLIFHLIEETAIYENSNDQSSFYAHFQTLRKLVYIELDTTNIDVGVNINATELAKNIGFVSNAQFLNMNLMAVVDNLLKYLTQHVYYADIAIAAKCQLLGCIDDGLKETDYKFEIVIKKLFENRFTIDAFKDDKLKLKFGFKVPVPPEEDTTIQTDEDPKTPEKSTDIVKTPNSAQKVYNDFKTVIREYYKFHIIKPYKPTQINERVFETAFCMPETDYVINIYKLLFTTEEKWNRHDSEKKMWEQLHSLVHICHAGDIINSALQSISQYLLSLHSEKLYFEN